MKKYIRIVTIVFVVCILSGVLALPSFASGENYFRGQLNANQKAVYDALIKAIPEKGTASCTVTATLPEPKIIVTNAFDDAFYDEFQEFLSDVCIKAIDAVRLDSQYFFWEQMSHYTTPSLGEFYGPPFTVTISQVEVTVDVASPFKDAASMTTEIKSAVAAIKPSGTTLYEKVKSIHDQICEKVTYDNAALTTDDLVAHTAYGALIKNKSVCEGYAKAFKLVCDKNGIDCIVVRGIATNSKGVTESHMWNYVKMDDGKWYGIDCTWDDAGDILRYKYFLFTSDVFSERTEDKELLVYPTLSKTAYSTAVEPGIPDAPIEPDFPDKPIEPDAPDNPIEPDDPDNPVEPDVPDNPIWPDNPDNPVEPDVPDNPIEPDNPDNPVEPDVPDNPVEPGIPDAPVEPDIPDKPIEPDIPDNSTEPESIIPAKYLIYGGIALAVVALIIVLICIFAKKKNKN